jgi:GR25 family glycosyltransferase involved in LPS biosynthesis
MNHSINPDFFKGIDQIYWINLERATDRFETMERMFQDSVFHGIPIHRTEAFDGSKYNAIHYFIFQSNMGPKMTNIEYACLLSHLNTIEHFAESEGDDSQVALILEDDMTLEFRPYWRKTIQNIMENAPPDWEVLQLAYIIKETYLPRKEYDEDFQWSAGAYLIKKSAAKRLMDSILIKKLDNEPKYFNLTGHQIHQADYLIYTLKTYLYRHPIFIYEYDNISYLNTDNNLLLARNYSKYKIQQMLEEETYKK